MLFTSGDGTSFDTPLQPVDPSRLIRNQAENLVLWHDLRDDLTLQLCWRSFNGRSDWQRAGGVVCITESSVDMLEVVMLEVVNVVRVIVKGVE